MGYEEHINRVNRSIQAEISEEEERNNSCSGRDFKCPYKWEHEHNGLKYCDECIKYVFEDQIETLMYDRLGSCLMTHEIVEVIADEYCEPEFVIVSAKLTGDMVIERFTVPVNQL